MDFKLSKTNPGNKCIIYDDYMYIFCLSKILKSGILNKRCVVKSCRVSNEIKNSECTEINEVRGLHSHEPKRKVERLQILVN